MSGEQKGSGDPKHTGLNRWTADAAKDMVELAQSDDPIVSKNALQTLIDALKSKRNPIIDQQPPQTK